MELFHNRAAFEGFVDTLRAKYGDVADAQPRVGPRLLVAPASPAGTSCGRRTATRVPPYDLAWRRYQSPITTEFIAAQAEHRARDSPARTSS